MTIFCSAIPSGHIRNVLVEILPQLDRAAAVTNGRNVTDDLIGDLIAETQVLWCAFDAERNNKIIGIVITKIVDYRRRRMMNIVFCAGFEMHSWRKDMFGKIEQFAKDQSCSGLEFIGRKGWAPVLEEHGMKPTYWMFEKTFEGE